MLLAAVRLQPWQMRDVEHVGAVPEEDSSITWTAIAADMGISTVSVFSILLKQVGRRKVCSKWIPCIPNEDQQATCVMLVNVYFQCWRSIPCLHFDSGWTVVALTGSELKCQIAEWYSAVSAWRKLHRNSRGALKLMYVVFFSPKELVLHHAVPPDTSVSDTYCAVVLHDNVWPVLRSKDHTCCKMVSSFSFT